MIIRNDDVAVDTDIKLFREFCELCDAYGHRIIQAITPAGKVRDISVYWDNEKILNYAGKEMFIDNAEVFEYVQSRNDLIGAHGFFHTHQPSDWNVRIALTLLRGWGFNPEYFIAPFNEGVYNDDEYGVKCLGYNCDRIETFFDNGRMPLTEIGYLHSWRFANSPYNLGQLENFFKIIQK